MQDFLSRLRAIAQVQGRPIVIVPDADDALVLLPLKEYEGLLAGRPAAAQQDAAPVFTETAPVKDGARVPVTASLGEEVRPRRISVRTSAQEIAPSALSRDARSTEERFFLEPLG